MPVAKTPLKLKMTIVDGFFRTLELIIERGSSLVAIYLICSTFYKVVSYSPEQIGALGALLRAFSDILSTLKLPVWGGWCASFGFGLLWAYERKAKKRAIKQLGYFRAQLEAHDPGGRSSSGLSSTGETPKG